MEKYPSWPKGHPWKGCRSLIAARGFKSLLLRSKSPSRVKHVRGSCSCRELRSLTEYGGFAGGQPLKVLAASAAALQRPSPGQARGIPAFAKRRGRFAHNVWRRIAETGRRSVRGEGSADVRVSAALMGGSVGRRPGSLRDPGQNAQVHFGLRRHFRAAGLVRARPACPEPPAGGVRMMKKCAAETRTG